MLVFSFLPRWTGDINLPPQHPVSRLVINFIFLHLGAAYIWVISCKEKTDLPPGVWIALAVAGVALCVMPPVFSGDAYEYLMRGRIFGVYHLNPYAHASGEFRSDPFYPYSIWHDLPENYGPAWVLMQWVAPTFFGFSVYGALVAHKMILLGFFALSGTLFYKISRVVGAEEAKPLTLLFILNPNLWVHHLVDGHNDIVMIFFMLVAVYGILNRSWLFAMVAGAMATLVKYTAVLLLPVLLMAASQIGAQTRRQKIYVAVAGTVAVLLMAAMFYGPFWIGRDTWKYFFVFKDWFYSNSIPYAAHLLLGKLGGAVGTAAVAFFFRCFFLTNAVLALGWLATRKELFPRNAFRALVWMFGALYVSYAIPFYGHHLNWALPFFILSGFPAKRVGLCLFSFAGIFAYFKRLSFLFLLAAAFYSAWIIYSQRTQNKEVRGHA